MSHYIVKLTVAEAGRDGELALTFNKRYLLIKRPSHKMVWFKKSPSALCKKSHILLYGLIAALAVVVNLYITITALTLLPPCRDHSSVNGTETNATITHGEEPMATENNHTKELYWTLFTCSLIFPNVAWIYYIMGIYSDLYESRLSRPRTLLMMAFTHLMMIIMFFIIAVTRRLDSHSFLLALVFQMGIIMFTILGYMFHIIFQYEEASINEKKFICKQLKIYLVQLLRVQGENIRNQEAAAA